MGLNKENIIILACALSAVSNSHALNRVARGASDSHYINEELKDSQKELRLSKRALQDCKAQERVLERQEKSIYQQQVEEYNSAMARRKKDCTTLCQHPASENSVGCTGGNYNLVRTNSTKPACLTFNEAYSGGANLSPNCIKALNAASSSGCFDELAKPPVPISAQMSARCDDFQTEVDTAEEEVDTLKSDLSQARKDCPNCELIDKMQELNKPKAIDHILGAMNALAPTVLGGMQMNMMSGLIKHQASAYANMYGQYIDYCNNTGIPCQSPFGPLGGGMGGGGGMNPFGGMGGGGMPFGPVGLNGMGGFPGGGGGGMIGMNPGFANGGFTAGGMINGFGAPVSNFGTGFNSAVFPNGPWAGTGAMGGGIGMPGGGAYPFGAPMGAMGGGMGMGGMPGMGMGGMPYANMGWSGLGMGGMGGYGGGMGNPYGSAMPMGYGMPFAQQPQSGLNLWGGIGLNIGL